MSRISLPNGTTFSMASAMGAAIAVTSVTNAKPPVATAAGHTLVDGDIILVESGWSSLSGRVARVDGVADGTFALEGFNTSLEERYPAGSGAGEVRKVQSWQQIAGVLGSSAEGGEQNFWQYSFLEDVGDDRQLPTTRSPMSMVLTIADDPTAPHFALLEEADDDRMPRVIRAALPKGRIIVFSAFVSVSKIPTIVKNEGMAQTVTLSLDGLPTRYNPVTP